MSKATGEEEEEEGEGSSSSGCHASLMLTLVSTPQKKTILYIFLLLLLFLESTVNSLCQVVENKRCGDESGREKENPVAEGKLAEFAKVTSTKKKKKDPN